MEYEMEKAKEKLIKNLEEKLETIVKFKNLNLPYERERYMCFGMILYAYDLDVVGPIEYDELCDKYFHCK